MKGLLGFVGQTMDGERPTTTPYAYNYTPTKPARGVGTYGATSFTWVCPSSGWWRFVMWGAGGFSTTLTTVGGASGSLVVADRYVNAGDAVQLSVAYSWAGLGTTADTTATFTNGEVLTAGSAPVTSGAGQAGGVAACNPAAGDIGINGNVSPASGGAAAPSYGTYRGGAATPYQAYAGATPGGGFPNDSTGGPTAGDGMILIHQVKLKA